jgi:LSD1 subclass zinc finger protein
MNELSNKCAVCGSLIDEEDLFCANCGTESPHARLAPSGADAGSLVTDNFKCRGCGAAMSYDAGAQSLRCPFCGSTDMAPQADHKVLAPSRVVPFCLKSEEAAAAMRAWLGKGFWRPGELVQEACLVKMTPIYVPYWIFQADTHTYWTADTNQTPPSARGDWYPLSGEHQGHYAGLIIGASGALSPAETQAICPFDFAPAVPPEAVDLKNAIVEEFSRPRKYARPLACECLEGMETQACAAQYVPGQSRNVHVNVQITGMAGEPVLLPVWIMAYKFRDRLYRFLLNGQTGRATGQAPVSLKKILAAIAIAILIVLAFVILCLAAFGGVLAVVASTIDCSSGHSAGFDDNGPSLAGRFCDIVSVWNGFTRSTKLHSDSALAAAWWRERKASACRVD